MKSTKSQLTIILIVVLVLVTISGLVIYLAKSGIQERTKINIEKTQEITTELQPITALVSNCLNGLAKDAILLIGKQAGYIYTSQGGTLNDYSDSDKGNLFIKYNDVNVGYNIVPPIGSFDDGSRVYSAYLPVYPWKIFPYKDDTSYGDSNRIYKGYFGRNKMPLLTKDNGLHSIQSNIESYVDKNIIKCLDFSLFENQGYKIKTDTPKSDAIIGNKDLTVNLILPLNIIHQKMKLNAELNEFSTIVNIRLKDIYFFTEELINNDISDIKFDIDADTNNKDSMTIELIKDVNNKDDIVIITEHNSLVYGNPYQYIFARKNRAPALHYIKSGSTPPYSPKAEDPDEDSYTFTTTITTPPKVEVSDGLLIDYQDIT